MKRKAILISVAVSAGLALAVGAYLLGAKQTADLAPAAVAEEVAINPAELTALKIIRARDTLRLANGRMDAIVGLEYARKYGHLIHKGRRAVLPMPSVDSERFDDARIMRAAARRDADLFIEKYSHNGGLTK